jgi:hypothetical protein
MLIATLVRRARRQSGGDGNQRIPSEPSTPTSRFAEYVLLYHRNGKVVLRFAFSTLMISMVAEGFQQDTRSANSVRERDVYAIYSQMLTNPHTSHGPDNNERYLISMTTGHGHPETPCVQPPKEREADFHEVLTDYERRKVTQRQLKQALSISKPYLLLSADEVKEFMQARFPRSPGGTSPEASERFRGVTDLFTLSDVYFDQQGGLALTAISSWCGGLCGSMQWKVFEKRDSKWEERRWTTCVMMAKLEYRTEGASVGSSRTRLAHGDPDSESER